MARPTLDAPQTFAEGGSFEVRNELEELVRRDLLGPWDGPEEKFKPKAMGPRERYLVGMLGPKHSPTSAIESADEMPDTETGVAGDAAEGTLPEVVSPQRTCPAAGAATPISPSSRESATFRRNPDLRTAEWEVLSAAKLPDPTPDFTLRRAFQPVPDELTDIYDDVVQAERLREVRALIGFTRLDAPDPEDPDLVKLVGLSRSRPSWVPASEVRGEGIFLRVPEELLQDWEERVAKSEALRLHREAYARHRSNRYSDRIASMSDFDEMAHWPGARFIALHTLSHMLIRTISLECGYSSASLSERIYSGTDEDPHRSGILIYTAVPDAEGTLGGLVSLAEPEQLVRLTRRALADARHCSSDPLCAERLPQAPADFLHGAACHVCLFVSETTCERGNKFLDRRFVVPVDDSGLALYPDMP